MIRTFFILVICLFAQSDIFAQDTFYVKKKNSPVVTPGAMTTAAWDTTNRDSIVSYTVEYQKPNGRIWVVLHQTGPYFNIPPEAVSTHKRILFTEIIAVDSNGRKYRQPDRYYVSGYWVQVKPPK